MSKDIYRGTSYRLRNRRIQLKELSWIFECPNCEYAMTGLTEENIRTIRNAHNITSHSSIIHDINWKDHFGDENTKEYKDRISSKYSSTMRAFS